MAFHNDAIFPTDISYNSRGGPGYLTQISRSADSGAEQRVSRWGGAGRHQFNVRYGIRSYADLAAVREFYHARRGAAAGFRYLDWLDCSTHEDHLHPDLSQGAGPGHNDVVLGEGDGEKTSFPLVKRYTSGGVVRARRITKPIEQSVKVGIDGAEQSSGWSVNDDTGHVLFTSAPDEGETITWGGLFHVPVRFSEELDQLLEATAEDVESGSLGDMRLIELINEEEAHPDEFFYGGGRVYDPMDADIEISLGLGRVIVVKPDTDGLTIFLPNPSLLPDGGPMFYLANCGDHPVEVRNHENDLILGDSTLAGQMMTVVLANGDWYGGMSGIA